MNAQLLAGIIAAIKDSPPAMEAIRAVCMECTRELLDSEVFPGLKDFIETTVCNYLIDNGFAQKA